MRSRIIIPMVALVACGTPQPPLADVDPSDIDALATALQRAGVPIGSDPLTGACPDGALALTVVPGATAARLRTRGWLALPRTAPPDMVGRVLTQIAALNHDLERGSLSIDTENGELHLTVSVSPAELSAPGGMAHATERLCTTASWLRPALDAALAPAHQD